MTSNCCPCSRRKSAGLLVCNHCWRAWPAPLRRRWQLCNNDIQRNHARALIAHAYSRRPASQCRAAKGGEVIGKQ